jgi:chaperonin GroEL (HSP60 family)
MENQIVVNDYRQMDKILKEERTYLLNMCKKIKKTGCNVLLIQKSILRDAVNDLSLHFLSKLKILAIKDIEREEIEFICKVNPLKTFLICRVLDVNLLPISTRSQRIDSVLRNSSTKYRRQETVSSRSRASNIKERPSVSSVMAQTCWSSKKQNVPCTMLSASFVVSSSESIPPPSNHLTSGH